MALYRPKDKNAVILDLRPWISGFVLKEYGHVDPHDQEDIVQEGCLALIQIVGKLDEQAPRFVNKEEYVFYVKAVVRNGIRDYILRLRSKFDISLYKLRRELKCSCPGRPRHHVDSCAKKELGEFMTNIGNEFEKIQEEEAEDPQEWLTRQRRLSLLSGISKSGRGMSIEECQDILGRVLDEYKSHLIEDNRWNFTPPPSHIAPLTVDTIQTPPLNLPHARTPLISDSIPADRIVKCASRFCEVDLRNVKTPERQRGFAYCSKSCRKEWPPIIVKLQAQYKAPIEVILEVSLKLFRSKRRTAEILNIAGSTMERLVGRFSIRENPK